MSTIPLLPPDRSHICIAFGSELWAQAFAGSGVGAAAAGSDAAGSDATGAEAAGADAAGADAADWEAAGAEAAGAVCGVADEQAATSRIAVNASAGNRTWYRIPCLLHVGPDGNSRTGHMPCRGVEDRRVHYHEQSRAYIRLRNIVMHDAREVASVGQLRLGINLWSQASD